MLRPLLFVVTILMILAPLLAWAQDAESFEQAQSLAIAQDKPILLEFFRDD